MRILLFLAAFLPMLCSFAADTKTAAAPAPSQQPAQEAGTHRLRPGDVLEVQIFGEEELKVKGPVEANGHVTLNLLGKVRVEGLTAEEASKKIRELYMVDYLVDPIVSVTVADYAKYRFTISGQVKNPGVYTFNASEKINILQAIAKAGGLTRTGAPGKIDVKRMVNGRQEVIKVDAKAAARESGTRVFEIQPEDIITVGESII